MPFPGARTVVVAALAFAACTREAPPAPAATMTCAVTEAAVHCEVSGQDGDQVAIVANRAWRGADEVHPGLFGQRCPSKVDPELERQGAGLLLLGVFANGRFVGDVPKARFADVPKPVVLQPVVSHAVDGTVQLRLGDAWSLHEDGAQLVVAPFASTRQWLAAVPDGIAFVLVPLLLMVWLRRSGSPRLRRAVLLAVGGTLAIAGVVRCLDPTLPPWPTAPDDAITVLERQYGTGVGALVDAVRARRGAADRLAFVVDPARHSEQQSLVAHLRQLLGNGQATDDVRTVPNGALCIVVTHRTGGGTTPVPASLRGDRLLTTAVGELWRVATP